MIRFYLGEEPLLRSVPSYDLSDPEAREEVMGRLDELVIKPRDGFGGHGVTIMPLATEGDRRKTIGLVRRRPERFVAQELVPLSTHPTVVGAGIAPRRVDLRPYVLSPAAGEPSVMQGGLTRYAKAADEMVVNSSQGGGGKDTWVLGPLRTWYEATLLGISGTTSSDRGHHLRGAPQGAGRARSRGRPAGKEMALGITYLKAIEEAGGLPMVMPPLDSDAIEPLLDRLDGICLSGGPDLDPALYAAEPHPELGPIEPDLDRFELAVAARADAREMPILAICRGTQALNIVRGGALHQHLPDLSDELAHRQTDPGTEPSHPVAVDPGSQLAEVFGGGEIELDRRQLLPPSGDRPARRRAAGQRPRPRRDDRGDRGPEPALPDRRPVARRDARPPGGRGGALPPLRRGLPRRRRRVRAGRARREVA